MNKSSFLLLLTIATSQSYAQVLSTPGGIVSNNGTTDHVIVDGYTKLVNPNGRTLLIERDDEDSWLTFHDPDNFWFSMGIDRSNAGVFTLNSGGVLGAAAHFVMTSSGNIGVGTPSPNEKLTVNGTIYGKEVKVDLSVPGPDYVFDSSYDLPSLEQVKAYIDTHKHLPEVPSATQMEEEGIKLGEMNMILLKKVEELTLYVIEQDKRISSLEDENNVLKRTVGKGKPFECSRR